MYYIIINEQQQGPYAREELLMRGLTPTTMVWTSGMADWQPASQVADLSDLFKASPAQRFNLEKEVRVERDVNVEQPYGGQQQYPQQPLYGQQPYPQQQPYGQQQYPQQPPYGQPPYPSGYTPTPTNWMPWAIVCTVLGLCSCIGLVLGIIAITKASAANKAYLMGDTPGGDAANSTAKVLTVIGLVFDGIGILINLSFLSTL